MVSQVSNVDHESLVDLFVLQHERRPFLQREVTILLKICESLMTAKQSLDQSVVMFMLMVDNEGAQFVQVLSERLGPSFKKKISDRFRTKLKPEG